ncbi:hypothetical protein [Lactiplantibacillus plantarum]|uniref:hypothetical protein n=1 Tax=Lactiplantibacillus plantarum TaxID=1590 RepID=UPI0007BB872E|nr:hypothetical protein [Lactiplantibacillus plantarum]KZU53143.1 Phospholipid-binding protein [Lactiplantibacillus plantarum]MCG0575249.1 phosphatidyl-ethanolamine binding protein (PEBP) [Lactiplantibacillus plantarum]
MQIKVDLDDGFLPRIYTSNANVKHSGQPILSFPIEIKSIPAITTAFAISLIDYDAVPRTGFPFIHWLATNIPVMDVTLLSVKRFVFRRSLCRTEST